MYFCGITDTDTDQVEVLRNFLKVIYADKGVIIPKNFLRNPKYNTLPINIDTKIKVIYNGNEVVVSEITTTPKGTYKKFIIKLFE